MGRLVLVRLQLSAQSVCDEMVYRLVSKTRLFGGVGSTPTRRTQASIAYLVKHRFCKPRCVVQVHVEAQIRLLVQW